MEKENNSDPQSWYANLCHSVAGYEFRKEDGSFDQQQTVSFMFSFKTKSGDGVELRQVIPLERGVAAGKMPMCPSFFLFENDSDKVNN